MFFRGSRYAAVAEAEITGPDGRVIRYKKVRFIPATPAERTHQVLQGERLDHLAHRYFRDAERFWRIADANAAMWPDDLLAEPGRRILIPPAEG
jgi:hypothetical protein